MYHKARHSILFILLLALAAPMAAWALTAEPIEVLQVPWGEDPAEFDLRDEPGCRVGPQSFRVDPASGEITILDPLAGELKAFLDGRLVERLDAPAAARDFVATDMGTVVFLAGNGLMSYRDGAETARFAPKAALPLIRRLDLSDGALVASYQDGSALHLTGDLAVGASGSSLHGVKRGSDLAEILSVDADGRERLVCDLSIDTGDLGGVRVVGTDARGRIYVDLDFIERAVPLEVRREVWVLSAAGDVLARLGIPTHYYTRLQRDLELTAAGDLYHMISAEDGIHVLKWSLQGITDGSYAGAYPVRFQERVHYNFQTDNAYVRESSTGAIFAGKATATRTEALATADTYVQHVWTATAANLSDGAVLAPDGDMVETPDWIVVGSNTSVPYKWGGTDLLTEFDAGIAAGDYAGDIDTDGSSTYARGVDCSGFVCRCWNTTTDYSSREMIDPAYGPITMPYSNWDEILPGDAIHKEGHVRMAIDSFVDGSVLAVEAAGSATNWSVGYTSYDMVDLEGYSPRYYIEIDGAPAFDTITSAGVNGDWTDAATWVGGVVPTSLDNVVIAADDTVIVREYTAECKNLSFGGDSAQIKMYSTSQLSVYGDFTLYSTSHCVFDQYWSTNDATIRFAGSAIQTLSGFYGSGGSTSFRDMIVEKDGGYLTTDGSGMRLGIQNSLTIVSGLFQLAEGDDIEGRWATSGNFTGNNLPDIVIQADGELYLADGDGAHHIRSDYDSSTGEHMAIGTVTIYGDATFRDASSYGINLSGIDVEAEGKVLVSTAMGGGEFMCGALHIKPDGELENYTTADCWGTNVVLTLDEGGLFDTKASSTIFPTSFTNNGTVRYSRDESTDQVITDMDYKRLEISFDEDNIKSWTLTDNRAIADTLRVNYYASLVLEADDAYSLTVGSLLWLTSGQLDNSDSDVELTIPDGATIRRANGVLAAAPSLGGQVNMVYSSMSDELTTSVEMPTASGLILGFSVIGDEAVHLSQSIDVSGDCTMEADLVTGAYTVTLNPTATLVELPGARILGTATTTRTVAQSVNQDFGGLGLEILAAGAAPGATTVVRTTGTALDIDGDASVERYFEVTPTVNTGLGATVIYHYDDTELGALNEAALQIFESFDAGSTWNGLSSALDDTLDTVTASGFASFSLLTLGEDGITAVDESGVPTRTEFVSQYPNPFNPATQIMFDLEKTGHVQVAIYDVRGKRVSMLENGTLASGRHTLTWRGLDDSGRAVASGVYFCRLQAAGETRTLKMMLAR